MRRARRVGRQDQVLRCLGREVQRAQALLGQEARAFGGGDAVDAAVERPPDAAADGDDVAHRERLGLVFEHARTRPAARRAEALDLAVDAGDDGLDDRAGRAVRRLRLARGDRRDADRAMRDVAAEIGGAEDLRLAAERAAAQPVHLPEPILRHGDAEAEIEVRRARREDMRHARAIPQDLDPAAHRALEVPVPRRGATAEQRLALGGEPVLARRRARAHRRKHGRVVEGHGTTPSRLPPDYRAARRGRQDRPGAASRRVHAFFRALPVSRSEPPERPAEPCRDRPRR